MELLNTEERCPKCKRCWAECDCELPASLFEDGPDDGAAASAPWLWEEYPD